MSTRPDSSPMVGQIRAKVSVPVASEFNGWAALIVAGGRGLRAGGEQPKQYQDIAGKAVLRRTVEAFLRHQTVQHVRVVVGADDLPLYQAAMADLQEAEPRLLPPVTGGAERQISVRLGLQSLADENPDIVFIHDAVRPFFGPQLLNDLAQALSSNMGGAIAGLPVVDTLKRQRDDQTISETVDRAGLWHAQTPQAFRFHDIRSAHEKFLDQFFTDDAAIMEAAGHKVALVTGERNNIKITTPADFVLAEQILSEKQMISSSRTFRSGQGFDVHRFGPGTSVTLCGISVPHDKSLAGHSDADVALHALTDALMGTIGGGDIGQHFPPTDPQWRGTASSTFVEKALQLIAEKNGRLEHVDLTIICERPKIGPHREAMQQRVADLLNLPLESVNIKATTTEGLGYTGRQEGIAAQAIATISLADRKV